MEKLETNYLEEYDKRYLKMRNLLITLLSIMGFLLTTLIATGLPQVSKISANEIRSTINTSGIKDIKDDCVSQNAINSLIMTFESQTRVMEEFLPDDVQGAMVEFRRVSSELRAWIIMYNSDLNTRGVEE